MLSIGAYSSAPFNTASGVPTVCTVVAYKGVPHWVVTKMGILRSYEFSSKDDLTMDITWYFRSIVRCFFRIFWEVPSLW